LVVSDLKEILMSLRLSVIGFLAVSVLLLTSRPALAATVLPGQSTVAGQTTGAWTANWWNWALSSGPGPISDPDGSRGGVNQAGPVFYLAGTTGGGAAVVRNIAVTDDKFILLPLINWIVAAGADPGFASTQAEANALATNTINPNNLFASIDGAAVGGLAGHREESGSLFTLNVVSNSDAGFPAGAYNDAYADGYWLMVAPLSAGNHTLHFGGTTSFFDAGAFQVNPFTVDVTVNLTVLPSATGGSGVPLSPALALTPFGC
jgi:hypothetical protein